MEFTLLYFNKLYYLKMFYNNFLFEYLFVVYPNPLDLKYYYRTQVEGNIKICFLTINVHILVKLHFSMVYFVYLAENTKYTL